MAKFTDSIIENMEQFKGLQLDGEERELAKKIGDEFFFVLSVIEKKYRYKSNVCKLALAFAIFSAADGMVASGSSVDEDGGSQIILPH